MKSSFMYILSKIVFILPDAMFLTKGLTIFSIISSLVLCSYLSLTDSSHNSLIVFMRDLLLLICCYLFNKYNITLNGPFEYICKHKLGPGQYAADSYFNEYLNIILPVSEVKNHSEIAERIEDYENIQEICIPIKKLLVLVPLSGETEPQIGKHVKDIIKSRQNLNNLSLDRAGIKKRKFSHTVYEVEVDDTSINVVAEYATPLKTLSEISKGHPELSKNSKTLIIEAFYSRLMEHLNDKPDCKKFVEIIKYGGKTLDDGALELQKWLKTKRDKGELTCSCLYSKEKRKESF